MIVGEYAYAHSSVALLSRATGATLWRQGPFVGLVAIARCSVSGRLLVVDVGPERHEQRNQALVELCRAHGRCTVVPEREWPGFAGVADARLRTVLLAGGGGGALFVGERLVVFH